MDVWITVGQAINTADTKHASSVSARLSVIFHKVASMEVVSVVSLKAFCTFNEGVLALAILLDVCRD